MRDLTGSQWRFVRVGVIRLSLGHTGVYFSGNPKQDCCNPVNMSWLRIWHPGEDQPICSWENIVHIVVSPVGSDLPIYEVKPERGKGRSRGLHRNFLMPCDQSPVDTTGAPQKGPKKTGKEAPAWNANSGIWGRQWRWVWATLITTPSFHPVNGKKRPSWSIRDGYCT